ncbi:MAG: hypothetical protein J6T48_07790 [Bacteroidales bacterium]|nr:hypothetical protein [Bacteroidales bacterium]
MKRFLIEILLELMISFIALSLIYITCNAYIDPYYNKFITGEQASMILGTSRANIGIRPDVINSRLKGVNIYNYAFNGHQSRWGLTYYNSIDNKLDKRSSDGLFILAVDPTSINSVFDENGNESFVREKLLKEVTDVSAPIINYQYIFNEINNPIYHIFTSKVHSDGFLELYAPYDSIGSENNKKTMIATFNNSQAKEKISPHRLEYLNKTIDLLKKHGNVYMVRLPTADYIRELEDSAFPEFDDRMETIAERHGISYINCKGNSDIYKYTIDGNHFVTEDSYSFTNDLCDSIMKIRESVNTIKADIV